MVDYKAAGHVYLLYRTCINHSDISSASAVLALTRLNKIHWQQRQLHLDNQNVLFRNGGGYSLMGKIEFVLEYIH